MYWRTETDLRPPCYVYRSLGTSPANKTNVSLISNRLQIATTVDLLIANTVCMCMCVCTHVGTLVCDRARALISFLAAAVCRIERFHVTSWPPCWCPLNNRILIPFYCLAHQHGRPFLGLSCLLGLSENIL